MWFNIPGPHLNTLITNPRYPGKPDVSRKMPGLETEENIDDNYGVRLTTYFMVSLCFIRVELISTITFSGKC